MGLARQYYEKLTMPAIARGNEWHWTLRLKPAPDQTIGAIELCKGEHNNRGFWLELPWHGQGLMSEACGAVTEYRYATL